MKIKSILRPAILTAVITGLAFAASLEAKPGKGKGNPFKSAKKGKPTKYQPPVCKPPPKLPKPTTFSGQAIVADLTNAHYGLHWVLGNTGPLPAAGGTIAVNVGVTNINDVVGLTMASSSTMGGGAQALSQVQIHNFASVFISADGVTNSISFTFAEAIASAQCTSNGVQLTGSTQIQGLVVNGASITVTGQNQVVTVANGSILLNAVLQSGTEKCPEVSAAAIYLELENCFTGVIGYVKADICCGGNGGNGGGNPPPVIGACGKVTGGGFILGTPSGEKGTFGVSGGIRRGEFWGHVNYVDHGTGMHVKSTAVTGFTVIDANTRQIDYDVTIDGAPGTARVIVSDRGEPGRDDIFDITLSTGYHAGGDLGGSGSGGGNIQLHKCPPGWAK